MISKTTNVKYEKDEKKRKLKAADKYTEIDFVQLVQVKIKIQIFFNLLVIMYTKTFILDFGGTNRDF